MLGRPTEARTKAFLSAVVALIIAVTKFADGAWAILLTLPLLVMLLLRLNRQYAAEAGFVSCEVAEIEHTMFRFYLLRAPA